MSSQGDQHTEGGADALAAALDGLPVPALDPGRSARALRRAHGELRMPGEGTLSLRGLVLAWDASLVPAIVLLTGAVYGVIAVQRIVEIFVG